MAKVVIEPGSLLNEYCDLCVLPRSVQGTVSIGVRNVANQKGLEIPKEHSETGDLVILPGPLSENPPCKFIGWATTVSATRADLQAIHTIAGKLSAYLSANSDIETVEMPLLGAGSGGVSYLDSCQELMRVFSSSEQTNAVIRIKVLDTDIYNKLVTQLAEAQSTTDDEQPTFGGNASIEVDEPTPNVSQTQPAAKNFTTRPLAWVETDSIPGAGLDAYQASKYDSLDLEKQASIFTTLLISKEVKPPLALCLLGDWGVGKSFFMRLMQEKISSIAGKKSRDFAPENVSRVAQIEFNAWHYIDSDLWASLASHIFNKLSEELREKEDKVEEIRRQLRSKIHSSKSEQAEAQAAILVAQDHRKKASETLLDKQKKRAQALVEFDKLRLTRVWNAVLSVKPDRNKPDQAGWPV
jgi:hypothetical protein